MKSNNENLIIIDDNKFNTPIQNPSKKETNTNYKILYRNNKNNNYDNHHFIKNIVKWKDQRLELIEIPRGLREILQNADFTIEKILESCPTDIAEKLGIDSFVGEIIFKETKKS